MTQPTKRIATAKREAFLRAYERLGTLHAAASETGVSTSTHYAWLARSEAYEKAFHEAEERSIQRLELEAIRRAVEGTQEPVYFNGQVVGTTRKKSDVPLIFLLKAKRPEVYRERLDARFQANLNVQSAVKVIHEYHAARPAIEAIQAELQPDAKLLTANIQDAITETDT